MALPGVDVDRSRSPAAIRFEPGFNAAPAFVDRNLAEGRGAKVAIRCAAGDVTYAELAERVNRCGNALLGQGLERGQRVLMVVKDSPEFFYVYWGAIKAGLVPVTLNTILRAADYQHMIDDSGCSAVVWSPEYDAEVRPALASARAAPRVALPTTGEGRSLLGLMAAASARLEAARSAASAPGFWAYSSGSTGRPKGVVHRQRDIVANSQFLGQDLLGVREDDVVFSAAKLFFAYGLGNAMTFPLWSGAGAGLSGIGLGVVAVARAVVVRPVAVGDAVEDGADHVGPDVAEPLEAPTDQLAVVLVVLDDQRHHVHDDRHLEGGRMRGGVEPPDVHGPDLQLSHPQIDPALHQDHGIGPHEVGHLIPDVGEGDDLDTTHEILETERSERLALLGELPLDAGRYAADGHEIPVSEGVDI